MGSRRMHLVLSETTATRAEAYQHDLGFKTLAGFIEAAVNGYIEDLREKRGEAKSQRHGLPPRPPTVDRPAPASSRRTAPRSTPQHRVVAPPPAPPAPLAPVRREYPKRFEWEAG